MIYLLKSNDKLKIGYTSNFASRISNYRSHNPDIEVVNIRAGELEDEKVLLEQFKHFSIFGEWFTYSKDIIKGFERHVLIQKPTIDCIETTELKEEIRSMIISDERGRKSTINKAKRLIQEEIHNTRNLDAVIIKCNDVVVYKRYGIRYTIHEELTNKTKNNDK